MVEAFLCCLFVSPRGPLSSGPPAVHAGCEVAAVSSFLLALLAMTSSGKYPRKVSVNFRKLEVSKRGIHVWQAIVFPIGRGHDHNELLHFS